MQGVIDFAAGRAAVGFPHVNSGDGYAASQPAFEHPSFLSPRKIGQRRGVPDPWHWVCLALLAGGKDEEGDMPLDLKGLAGDGEPFPAALGRQDPDEGDGKEGKQSDHGAIVGVIPGQGNP